MADKTVIIKTLTANDFPRINIKNVAGTLTVTGVYQIKTSTGVAIDSLKSVDIVITTAQKQTLVDFLINNVGLVAAANTQEGM